MRPFTELLQEDIEGYDGLFADQIAWVPKLFEFMSLLSEEQRLDRNARVLINASLAYFVLPFDVIPETGMGAYGYIDDLYLCAQVLHELQGHARLAEILDEHWPHEVALPILLGQLLGKLKEALDDDDRAEILRLAGIGG